MELFVESGYCFNIDIPVIQKWDLKILHQLTIFRMKHYTMTNVSVSNYLSTSFHSLLCVEIWLNEVSALTLIQNNWGKLGFPLLQRQNVFVKFSQTWPQC